MFGAKSNAGGLLLTVSNGLARAFPLKQLATALSVRASQSYAGSTRTTEVGWWQETAGPLYAAGSAATHRRAHRAAAQ